MGVGFSSFSFRDDDGRVAPPIHPSQVDRDHPTNYPFPLELGDVAFISQALRRQYKNLLKGPTSSRDPRRKILHFFSRIQECVILYRDVFEHIRSTQNLD